MPFYEERVKYETKQKHTEMNLLAWLNGFYVYRSLAGLNGKPYVDEPLQIFSEEVAYKSKEEVTEAKTEEAADGFRAYAFMFNREREKKRKNRKEVQEINGEHRQSVNTTDGIDQQGERRTNETNIETEHTE